MKVFFCQYSLVLNCVLTFNAFVTDLEGLMDTQEELNRKCRWIFKGSCSLKVSVYVGLGVCRCQRKRAEFNSPTEQNLARFRHLSVFWVVPRSKRRAQRTVWSLCSLKKKNAFGKDSRSVSKECLYHYGNTGLL